MRLSRCGTVPRPTHPEVRLEAMDVLQFWSPKIDWSQFKQGAVSDRMWSHFRDIVQLCHAHRRWSLAVAKLGPAPPGPSRIAIGDRKRTIKRRRHDWELEAAQAKRHMTRASFLAAERMSLMSNLLNDENSGPDWKLYSSLSLALRHQPH